MKVTIYHTFGRAPDDPTTYVVESGREPDDAAAFAKSVQDAFVRDVTLSVKRIEVER